MLSFSYQGKSKQFKCLYDFYLRSINIDWLNTWDRRMWRGNYFESSKKVWNLWREDIACFAPKNADGQWLDPFDPTKF